MTTETATIAIDENVYSLAMALLKTSEVEEVRHQLHTVVDAICDGIEYGEND